MLFKVLLAGMCSLCLVGTATLASAHEFIVKPDKTQAAKGESVGVQAQAAHVFMISEEAEPVETVVIELIQGNAKEPVKLAEDAKAKALVGKAALPADGPAMIVGHRLPQTWSDTTEGVLEGGRKDLEAKGKKVLKVGKYEKFAKTMLNPAANDGLYKKVLGHDLEIVLLTNPADIKAGDDIKAEVLLNGKPVKAPLGLTYDGYSAEQDAYMAKAETGADGMASFKVTKPGLWMLRTEVTEKLTDGSAGNRNAYYSWAVAPGFHNLRKGGRVKCSRKRTGPFVKGEILPGRKARNRPLWPRHGRCLHGGVLCYPRFMCRGHAV